LGSLQQFDGNTWKRWQVFNLDRNQIYHLRIFHLSPEPFFLPQQFNLTILALKQTL
jgi:hypothetical protein